MITSVVEGFGFGMAMMALFLLCIQSWMHPDQTLRRIALDNLWIVAFVFYGGLLCVFAETLRHLRGRH